MAEWLCLGRIAIGRVLVVVVRMLSRRFAVRRTFFCQRLWGTFRVAHCQMGAVFGDDDSGIWAGTFYVVHS